MKNPVTAILHFLEKQPVEIIDEIAFLVGMVSPLFDEDEIEFFSSGYGARFVEKIKSFETGEMKDAGFVVAFKANFNFSICRKRGTLDGWERPKALFENVLEDPSTPETMKSTARKSLEDMPNRIALWTSLSNEWKSLETDALSDENIEQWEDWHMVKRMKETKLMPPRDFHT